MAVKIPRAKVQVKVWAPGLTSEFIPVRGPGHAFATDADANRFVHLSLTEIATMYDDSLTVEGRQAKIQALAAERRALIDKGPNPVKILDATV